MNMINEKLICEIHVEWDKRTWYAIRHKNRCGDLAHERGNNFEKMASYKGCECAEENSTEILDLDKFIKDNRWVPSYEDFNPLSRYIIGKDYNHHEERPPIDIVNEDIMDMSFEDFRRMLGFCRFYFECKYKVFGRWHNGYFMLAPKLIKNYDEIAKEETEIQINHIAWFVRNIEPCIYKKISLMNDNITYNSEGKLENYEDIENDKKMKLMITCRREIMYYQMNVRQFIHFLCTTKVPTNTLKMHVVGVMIVKVMQKLLSEIDDEDERYQELLNAVNTIIEKKRTNMLDISRKKNVFRDWIVNYAEEYEAKNPEIEVKITELIQKLRRR